MSDYLVRSMSKDGSIRGLAAVSTALVEEARRRHGALPTAAAALGRALTGGALLGAGLKTGQRVALKFEGDGPLKKIVVEAESNGAVRGYVAEPGVHLPSKNGKLDVAGAVGRTGLLTVSKDLRLKEPYQGIVQLVSGEIAEDLAFYLAESEQVPSAVALGVYVETHGAVAAAGGFLIQTLPPVREEILEQLIARHQKTAVSNRFITLREKSGSNPGGHLWRSALLDPGQIRFGLAMLLQPGAAGKGPHYPGAGGIGESGGRRRSSKHNVRILSAGIYL